MAKAPTKQNLVINARVDGAGNVTSEVRKINTTIAATAAAARLASNDVAEYTESFSALKNIGTKINGAMEVAAKGIGAATSGVRAMSGAISGLLGTFGPWIAAINLAVDAAHFLWDYFHDEAQPTAEAQVESVRSLAEAYLQLGESADWEAARQKIAAEEAQKATIQAADDAQKQLRFAEKRVAAAKAAASATAADAEGAKLRYGLASDEAIEAMNLRDEAQKKLAIAEKELATRQKSFELAKAEIEEMRAERAIEQAQEAAAEKAVADAAQAEKDREAAQRAAAQRAAAQRQAEISAVDALWRQADEARWAAEKHSDEENLARQVDQKTQAAEAQIKDAYRLAEAIDAIDSWAQAQRDKRNAEAAEKRAAETEKWLADAKKRADAQTTPQIEDAEEAKIAEQITKTRDEIAALNADWDRFQALSSAELDQYGEQYLATMDAIEAAEQKEANLREQLAARRKQIAKETLFSETKNAIAISKENQEAIDAQIKGYNQLAEGLETAGVGMNVMRAAQMTAAGLQATSDAINYTAEAAANFAIGNVGTALGLTAAAAGKTAAAVKYARSLVELGFSAFDTSGGGSSAASTQAAPSTSALTGQTSETKTTDINISMSFAGQAGRIGRYLIDEINAEARTAGGARVNSQVLR